ncbi:MAG TPA: NADH-quinone oxidoreductase subunit A [Usitatibacter sp.]|nr:NADH-quinone oxidoreductase subunit A [Usitatibacter sp.]
MEAAAIHERLAGKFGEGIASFDGAALQPWALVSPDAIDAVAAFAKSDPELSFDNLMCLSAADYPKADPPCLEVVYHLWSYERRHSFVLKVRLPRDGARVPTVEATWAVANWHEREAYDMFGIVFEGHSDLRRILLPWAVVFRELGHSGPLVLMEGLVFIAILAVALAYVWRKGDLEWVRSEDRAL